MLQVLRNPSCGIPRKKTMTKTGKRAEEPRRNNTGKNGCFTNRRKAGNPITNLKLALAVNSGGQFRRSTRVALVGCQLNEQLGVW